MREILDPLRGQPGVVRAALFTDEGLVLASLSQSSEEADAAAARLGLWIGQAQHSLDALAWQSPADFRLEGTQGVVSVRPLAGLWVAIWAETTLPQEHIDLCFKGVEARLQRALKLTLGEALFEPAAALPAAPAGQRIHSNHPQQTKDA